MHSDMLLVMNSTKVEFPEVNADDLGLCIYTLQPFTSSLYSPI